MNRLPFTVFRYAFATLIALFLGGWSLHARADDADQGDSKTYWKGGEINNLGRLGKTFDNFEETSENKQNGKYSEEYLLKIRKQIAAQGKENQNERSLIDAAARTPDGALTVVYVQKGYIRATLRAGGLFDENTAALKSGSMVVLERLAGLLQTQQGNHVELTFLDDLDDSPESKNVDAERALVVYSLINFQRQADNDNS